MPHPAKVWSVSRTCCVLGFLPDTLCNILSLIHSFILIHFISHNTHIIHTNTHMHSSLTVILPSEPGLARCPFWLPSSNHCRPVHQNRGVRESTWLLLQTFVGRIGLPFVLSTCAKIIHWSSYFLQPRTKVLLLLLLKSIFKCRIVVILWFCVLVVMTMMSLESLTRLQSGRSWCVACMDKRQYVVVLLFSPRWL